MPLLLSPDVLRTRSSTRLVNAARVAGAALSPLVFFLAFFPVCVPPQAGLVPWALCILPLAFGAGSVMRELATHRALLRVAWASLRAAFPFAITGHATLFALGRTPPLPWLEVAFFAWSLFSTAMAALALSLVSFSLMAPHFESLAHPAQNTPSRASLFAACVVLGPSLFLIGGLYLWVGALASAVAGCLFGAFVLAYAIQAFREHLRARRDRIEVLRGVPLEAQLADVAGLEKDLPFHEQDRDCKQKNHIEIRSGLPYRDPGKTRVYVERPTGIDVPNVSPP